MSSVPAIVFQGVVKEFRTGSVMSAGLKGLLLNLHRQIRQARQGGRFRALDGVSFEVDRGQCVGVIGRNGSGKSTTLGLIAGVLRANDGQVRVNGHICPLLELGAGFHGDLSGLENIYLNGVLMGMTRRQVRQRAGAIAEFSELGEFLDRPLRTYSTGMMVRLGFSVAVHLDPDILLVDEVLAVGDAGFADKCRDKMDAFRRQGVTIVFVSHALADVRRLCDRAIWLDAGRIRADGDAREVCGLYEQWVHTPNA